MRLAGYWATGRLVEIRPGTVAEVTAATWVQDVGTWASHADLAYEADRVVAGEDWLLAVCWAPRMPPGAPESPQERRTAPRKGVPR